MTSASASSYIQDYTTNGFTILNNIYSRQEVENILRAIDLAQPSNETFRKSAEVFAIRQFLKEVPATQQMIFNDRLKTILTEIFGTNFLVVKSIYFDKPQTSNWYVSYHQDLTISVDKKTELEGYHFWTNKQNQFAVQPPVDLLENIITIRIHLDDTNENNGALKVIPKSHLKGIYRPEKINWTIESEISCAVNSGGIMLMKPLLLHSSGRTTNNRRRRVIHIEFSNRELPTELNWAERLDIAKKSDHGNT